MAAGELMVHGACPHDCYDTCSLRVHVEDGVIRRIEGDPSHPLTRGFLCYKVNHYLERLNHPQRVLHPLRRRGAKGAGEFERVTWDEAMAEIGERVQRVLREHGGEAVLPYSFAGNMGLLAGGALDARLWGRIGASRLERTICTAAGHAALRWVFGTVMGPDPETIPAAAFVLLWGANPMATNVHQIPLLDEARKAGGEVWTIDPLRTETARRYDRHIQPRPATDLALALGLGRELVATGRYDREFAEERAEGFGDYLGLVEPWSITRTAEVTGLEPAAIAELAERIAAARPLLLRPGYGVQRQSESAATVWAIAALSVISGAWRDVGGGLLMGNSDAFPLRDLAPAQGAARSVNMVQLGDALLDLTKPPVQALFVYNANPAATAPDQSRVLAGLAREDLLTVVHEQMLTDTAKYADFVLPAAMSMEVLDLHTSYWHRYVQLSLPAVPPPGEAVSNPEFFRRLARAFGLTDAELQSDDRSLIEEALTSGHPWLDGITFEALLREPVQKLRLPAETRPFVDLPVPRPGGRLQLALPPGTMTAQAVAAGRGRPGEFDLLTPSTRETIKSSFGNLPSLRRGHPLPELLMAGEDMARLGIAHGTRVRVWNERGEVELTALASDVPQPGSVVSYAVRWNHEDQGRNVNRLTSQALSDYGGGATFYTVRVRIEAAG